MSRRIERSLPFFQESQLPLRRTDVSLRTPRASRAVQYGHATVRRPCGCPAGALATAVSSIHLRAIPVCRTPALGGQVDVCSRCASRTGLSLVPPSALPDAPEAGPSPMDRAAPGARPRRRLLPRRLHAPRRAATPVSWGEYVRRRPHGQRITAPTQRERSRPRRTGALRTPRSPTARLTHTSGFGLDLRRYSIGGGGTRSSRGLAGMPMTR